VITLADRARDTGQWEVAARLYSQGSDRNPRIRRFGSYGHALKEHGHLASAESAYRRAIGCDPVDADAYLQLGHVLKLQAKPMRLALPICVRLPDPSCAYAAVELVKLAGRRLTLAS